ncbi:hypothetical protein KDW54_03885 [Burkholderia ambifaria]|uniref:hypothetical protein n=1 Tax=Burkholderia ambifaria TaxID=152480 RepID=UPI001B924D25|nr:hypothetical protein [Burkholderia ambifaria]MBR8181531.1 hypothetical protein [Burkholderia ambifaria]
MITYACTLDIGEVRLAPSGISSPVRMRRIEITERFFGESEKSPDAGNEMTDGRYRAGPNSG